MKVLAENIVRRWTIPPLWEATVNLESNDKTSTVWVRVRGLTLGSIRGKLEDQDTLAGLTLYTSHRDEAKRRRRGGSVYAPNFMSLAGNRREYLKSKGVDVIDPEARS